MKQLAAILFLVVILFNFYGYRIVISCMEANSDASFEKQVDNNNYDSRQLTSIKTKLDLPYYNSSAEYERAYGSVVIEGVEYQYVKRRVYKDTLELLCLPNDAKTKIQSLKNEMTKAFADGQTSIPKKHTTFKIPLLHFFQPFKTVESICFLNAKPSSFERNPHTTTGYILKHKKPPKSFHLS